MNYPSSFYVVHKLFTGTPFTSPGVWGDILDGPVSDFDMVIDLVLEYVDDVTDCQDVRAWHITDGKAVNVTDEVVKALKERMGEGK